MRRDQPEFVRLMTSGVISRGQQPERHTGVGPVARELQEKTSQIVSLAPEVMLIMATAIAKKKPRNASRMRP